MLVVRVQLLQRPCVVCPLLLLWVHQIIQDRSRVDLHMYILLPGLLLLLLRVTALLTLPLLPPMRELPQLWKLLPPILCLLYVLLLLPTLLICLLLLLLLPHFLVLLMHPLIIRLLLLLLLLPVIVRLLLVLARLLLLLLQIIITIIAIVPLLLAAVLRMQPVRRPQTTVAQLL
jgi:hypothetical protein